MLDNCAGEGKDTENLAERREDGREKMAGKAVLWFYICVYICMTCLIYLFIYLCLIYVCYMLYMLCYMLYVLFEIHYRKIMYYYNGYFPTLFHL